MFVEGDEALVEAEEDIRLACDLEGLEGGSFLNLALDRHGFFGRLQIDQHDAFVKEEHELIVDDGDGIDLPIVLVFDAQKGLTRQSIYDNGAIFGEKKQSVTEVVEPRQAAFGDGAAGFERNSPFLDPFVEVEEGEVVLDLEEVPMIRPPAAVDILELELLEFGRPIDCAGGDVEASGTLFRRIEQVFLADEPGVFVVKLR